MFEDTGTVLSMIWIYAAVGFFLAVLYNLFRFPRLAFPKMKKLAAVLDFLFAVIAGFVLFVFSAAYGSGFFRFYYVAAAALGFAVNMITIGLAVPPLSRLFGRACRYISAKLMIPICYIRQKSTKMFVEIAKMLSNNAEKLKKYLKNNNKIVYNSSDHKIGKVYPEGGENRNAVKAKVRKIL
ncbi:MAG: spore cortex biosynthesis protein YabQ [Ruminiclostridium sp.]|nr:spore cortex biosynthesis protein YabQ [Ruminiclostridium sp.]